MFVVLQNRKEKEKENAAPKREQGQALPCQKVFRNFSVTRLWVRLCGRFHPLLKKAEEKVVREAKERQKKDKRKAYSRPRQKKRPKKDKTVKQSQRLSLFSKKIYPAK